MSKIWQHSDAESWYTYIGWYQFRPIFSRWNQRFFHNVQHGDVDGILKQLLAPDNAQKIFCNCLATLRLNYLIPPLPKTQNKRINFRTEFKIKELFSRMQSYYKHKAVIHLTLRQLARPNFEAQRLVKNIQNNQKYSKDNLGSILLI